MSSRLISLEAYARELGVDRPTLRRMIAEGKVCQPVDVTPGGITRFSRERIAAFEAERGRQHATDGAA